MAIQHGQVAPDFEQDSTQGQIRFHDWQDSSWTVYFSQGERALKARRL